MNTDHVRPEDQIPRNTLANTLGAVRKMLNGDRFANLYKAVVGALGGVQKKTFLLDYGCGAMNFSRRLYEDGIIEDFFGVDIFPKPTDKEEAFWGNYEQINADGSFTTPRVADVAIIVDVLHHIPEDRHVSVLQKVAEKADCIVVKDHFEHGPISRQILRAADWYGNYAYGVSIPDRYFSKKRWNKLVMDAGLKELSITNPVKVHEGLFGVIMRPKNHFISVLSKA